LQLSADSNITKALELAAGSPCKIFSMPCCAQKGIPMQSVKQEPIYLPDVENNPQPSHYADMIRKMQNSGGEYWQIWHLFAFRPETTMHLARFTQGIMREPAPVSSGLRELIAAYTSKLNEV
jgi:hypothetical protein